jgi:hypothetical protein
MDEDDGIAMTVSDAEFQLIGIIRQHHESGRGGFTVTIHADNGRWNASLEDHDTGIVGSGTGSDFASAWNDIVDLRLRRA